MAVLISISKGSFGPVIGSLCWCILHVAKVLQKISFRFHRCFGCEVLANTGGIILWKSCSTVVSVAVDRQMQR